MEPRLAAREACQRFVALFAAYAPSGDSETLSRLLKPFLRILRHSKRITVGPCTLNLTNLVWKHYGWAHELVGVLVWSALCMRAQCLARPIHWRCTLAWGRTHADHI